MKENSFILIFLHAKLAHVEVHTYNWYKIVVFPALSKPTIITLCSVGKKKKAKDNFYNSEIYPGCVPFRKLNYSILFPMSLRLS